MLKSLSTYLAAPLSQQEFHHSIGTFYTGIHTQRQHFTYRIVVVFIYVHIWTKCEYNAYDDNL